MKLEPAQIVHGYTPYEINAIIHKAVLAERERCARIAEEYRSDDDTIAHALGASNNIAAAIRSGK